MEVNDLYVYSVFNGLLDDGQVPYRDFGFEYPPLAAPVIWVPWAISSAHFDWSLGAFMLLWWLGAQELVRRLAGTTGAWLMAASPVVCGALVRTHFDAVPVAITLGALLCLTRRKDAAAFVLLALGGLTKLFPLVLAPLAALWARSLRGLLLAAAVTLAGVLPFVAMGGFDFMLRFHLDRPVQLESTPASVVYGISDPGKDNAFKSDGVTGPTADAVQALFTLLQLAALAGITYAARFRPRDRDHLLRCAFAAVLAFVALGKVLSPQYVMWLYPFAAIAWVRGDRTAAACTFAAIAVTQVWFPSRYFDLVAEDPTLLGVVALRNTLLLTALAATAGALVRSRPLAASGPVRTSPARP